MQRRFDEKAQREKLFLPKAFLKAYYRAKPIIPRSVQIALRRKLALWIRRLKKDVWPIDAKSQTPPEGWKGWKDNKPFCLILTHDVDTAKGYLTHYKLLEIEKEMGFVSSFNFVPERYQLYPADLQKVQAAGFEVGVHGLNHDGKLFISEQIFFQRAVKINKYLEKWNSVGFRAPSMHRDLDLIKHLNIQYDSSTFDTDPFEPQADGIHTIFPFPVFDDGQKLCYWEMPYTLAQDFTLFVILRERSINIWRTKLDWIAKNRGMALINTHPDYINFGNRRSGKEEYPVKHYRDFLSYVKNQYGGSVWNPLPKEMVEFLNERYTAAGNPYRM
jgi:peptidoglycan/xylan/chitin deacetylase (PgdA/CDA1 family)